MITMGLAVAIVTISSSSSSSTLAFPLHQPPPPTPTRPTPHSGCSTRLYSSFGRVNLDTVSDIGYQVTLVKPMGIVFGENRAPFKGVSIDQVTPDGPGDAAGLKVGDQLMAVNSKSVIGSDFDRALTMIQNAPAPVDLQLYRGTVKSLFTIVLNRRSDEDETDDENSSPDEPDEDDDEGMVSDDDIVFDENYESPVIMSAEEFGDDTISISGVATEAAKSVGNIFSPKGIGGFFGKMFPQETIQLEDKDGK